VSIYDAFAKTYRLATPSFIASAEMLIAMIEVFTGKFND
jgi:hypothetical protein